MARLKNRPISHLSPARTAVVALCALIGAFLMVGLTQPTLNFVYETVSRAMKPDSAAVAPEIVSQRPNETPKPDPAVKPNQTAERKDPNQTVEPKDPKEPVATDPNKPGATQPNAPTNSGGQPTVKAKVDANTTTESYNPNLGNLITFAFMGLLLGGYLGNRMMDAVERQAERWDKMEAGEKVNVFLGVFAGFMLSVPFSQMFQALGVPGTLFAVIMVASVIGLGSLTLYVLQSMREVLPWTQGRVKSKRTGIKLFDTNVLIDGRILDVAKAGFMEGQVYVPGFVLDELQKIADNSDPLRRARGRRGLDVLKQLQSEFEMEARVHDRLAPEQGDDVDHRLVRLAKALGADIVTNDFNLKRVAEIQEVRVMSLNDLALALRPNVLPAEVLPALKIIKEGREYGQGVGYLDDGTMVVVENGGGHIGETTDVMVTQVIQTERGKMIFAEIEGEEVPGARPIRRGTRGPRA